jgi:alpha-glucosidase
MRRRIRSIVALAPVLSALTVASLCQPAAPPADPWWKHAVIYEIYPRSFQDSNGDGTGDLNGITRRLDYLQSLGVDALWLSPVYPSPQIDFGYDISDYENIDPRYGTLADFDKLVAEAKKRNIRIVMDMVLNHTSDQHKWFQESRSSRTNPRQDWYVWRDGKAGDTTGTNPPNNWLSMFGHSSWQYDATRGQYYYHQFYKQQPDLNWRNPDVEKAMFASMRFWLDRGVAGFRLDAINYLFEDPNIPDAKPTGGTNEFGDPKQSNAPYYDMPEEHDVARRMRIMTDSYPGARVLIGEVYLDDPAALDVWYGGARHDELQLPMDMAVGFAKKFDAPTLRRALVDASTKIDGNQPLFVFDNHDNHRSWDRLGDGVHNAAIARVIAAILLTTRATALLYYGQEIGMVTSTPTRKEDVQDPIGITGWPQEKGRDGERTPMQWNSSKNSGFTTSAKPWLPVPASASTVNVAVEEKDPTSLLNWYKKLIAMRRTNPALHDGAFRMLDAGNTTVLSYLREGAAGSPALLVMMNVSAEPQKAVVDASARAKALHTLLTDEPSLDKIDASGSITLPPFATWVGTVQ